MTVDCQWIENNLEALSCDSMDAEKSGLARKHIESCGSCRKEVEALNAIDPLIKQHFQRQFEIARQPRQSRAVQKGRILGLSAAAVAIAAVLLFVVLPGPQPIPLAPVQPQIAPVASGETPAAPVKSNGTGEVDRTKPAPAPNKPIDSQPPAQTVVTENAPDFLVIDAAGYSHTLDDYRGHVAVIALLNQKQGEATTNFDNLYRTYGANPKFRFLGVSGSHAAKPANTTFPVVYNQGSKLFGARPGQFLLIDEIGRNKLRGDLVTDFESLRKALEGN